MAPSSARRPPLAATSPHRQHRSPQTLGANTTAHLLEHPSVFVGDCHTALASQALSWEDTCDGNFPALRPLAAASPLPKCNVENSMSDPRSTHPGASDQPESSVTRQTVYADSVATATHTQLDAKILGTVNSPAAESDSNSIEANSKYVTLDMLTVQLTSITKLLVDKNAKSLRTTTCKLHSMLQLAHSSRDAATHKHVAELEVAMQAGAARLTRPKELELTMQSASTTSNTTTGRWQRGTTHGPRHWSRCSLNSLALIVNSMRREIMEAFDQRAPGLDNDIDELQQQTSTEEHVQHLQGHEPTVDNYDGSAHFDSYFDTLLSNIRE
ncbi:unnamed protein product, partial [Prorocentrum cordatum]